MNEKTWWYLARATGLAAWALVAAATLFGLALSTRIAKGKVTSPWLLDLHRHLGGLGLLFTGFHVAGLVADNYLRFGWTEVLVPFASAWKPAPVAAGVVAMYLLAAVEVTSLLQRRISRRWWRRVHSASFALFVVTSAHALTSGTDAGHPATRVAAAALLLSFAFLLSYRVAIALGPTSTSSGASVPVRSQQAVR